MSDIESLYRSRVAAQEEARLRQGLDEALAEEQTAAATPKPAAAPTPEAKPAGPKEPKLSKLGEVASETAFEGIKNFGQGIANFIVPPTGQTPGDVLAERGQGLGQSALGVMQLLMALPAGIGASFREGLKNFRPGMEDEPLIPKGSVAGKARAILSAPSLLFDPKVKAADPRDLAESLDAPITYGEALDLAVQFATGGAFAKALKVGGAPKAAAPAQRALPPAPYAQGPSPVAVSLTDRLAADFAMGRRYQAAEDAMAARIAERRAASQGGQRELASDAPLDVPGAEATPTAPGTVLDASGRPVASAGETPMSRGDMRARYRTPLDAPERAGEMLPEDVMPSGELVQTLDLAQRRAEQAIKKELDEAGAKLKEALEKAPEEPAKPEAPKGEAEPAKRVPPPTEAEKVAVTGEQAALAEELKALQKGFGERGKTTADLAPMLARMALGAAVGGSQGDTPGERILNAFLTAGLSAALSKRLALKVSESYKASRLADETGAIDLGRFGRKKTAQADVPFEPNYQHIETTPQVTKYIEKLYDTIKTDIAEQGRGIRPHVRMDADAARMLRDGTMTPDRILGFRPGTVLNDSQLKAARHIEVRAAEEATRLMDQRDAGVAVNPNEIAHSVAVSGAISINVRSAVKETGRALSSMRADASSRNTAATVVHSERIALVAERMRAGATIDEIVAAWRSLKTVEKKSAFARLVYALPEAILEAHYGSILSGLAISRNALSILSVAPMEIMTRSLAAYHPRNVLKMAKGDPAAISFSEGPMGAVAFAEAAVEQIRMLRHFDDIRAQAEALGNTRMEVRPRGFEAIADIARDTGHSNLAKGADYLHTGYSIGPEIMRATDGMSKAIAGRIAIQWEAMQQAGVEGLRGSAYWQRAREYVDDYSKLSPAAHQRIADAREHMTFTKDLEGRLSGALQSGPSNPWLDLIYRMNFATFVRTPARIMEFTNEYTPVLNGAAKHFWTEWLKGGNARTIAETRVAAGATIIGAFGYLTMQGFITPPEPDLVRRKLLTEAGRPPGHWWDAASEKWRTYQNFEPLSTLIATGSTVADYMRQVPDADAAHIFLAGVLAHIDNLGAKSYTQAISRFVDLVKNPHNDSRVEAGLRYIRDKLSSFAPAAFREIERVVDPEERRARPSGAFDDGTLTGAAQREFFALIDAYRVTLPGMSSAKDEQGVDLIPAEPNMFTGEDLVNTSWPYNPWRAREGNDAPWAVEIRRLKGAGLRPVDEWIGRRAAADVGFTDQPASPGVRLDLHERVRLIKLMTQMKVAGQTFTESVDQMVQSDLYRAQSDVTKRTWIQAEWALYRQAAEAQLLRENSALRGAVLVQQGKASIEQAPPARQPDLTERLNQMMKNLTDSLGR